MSVAVDMRTLLDRNIFSSRTNGQVAARRVTGLIIKRLWSDVQFVRVQTFEVMLWCGGCSAVWHAMVRYYSASEENNNKINITQRLEC